MLHKYNSYRHILTIRIIISKTNSHKEEEEDTRIIISTAILVIRNAKTLWITTLLIYLKKK